MKVKTKEDSRQRIRDRIRKKIHGSPERPRLAVFRSQEHIYAQVIDDDQGRTLCCASSLDKDLKTKLKTGGNVLIRNTTLLTVTNGTLPRTDLLVRNGKIAQIGANIPAPEGTAVLDAEGMFVMPGIIDTHCHFSIAGGVNEFSLSVVPEVRVRDVIDGEDVQIFRSLAGGVTTARLLHGSANCIGGQDAVTEAREPAQTHA